MAEKWINMEEDEAFFQVVKEINWNHSPATNNIKYYMRSLLSKHGYGWDYAESKVIKRVEVDLKAPVMRSDGRKPISGEKVAEIQRMRLEGHSMRSIAKAVGVGRGTVEKYSSV